MTGGTGRLRLPSGLVRAALDGHSVLGLTVAALLFVVALTGTMAMFVPELDYWQERAAPVVETVSPALAARAVASLPGDVRGLRRVTLDYPTPTLPRLVVSANPMRGEARRFAVDSDGTVQSLGVPWSDFLVALHERLTIPGMTGLVLVGLLGVAMLALAGGGLLAHPRLFRDAFLFRAGGGERMRQADMHNRLSVWPLPFHLAIAFTGAALGLSLPLAMLVGRIAYHAPPAAIGEKLLGPSAGKAGAAAPIADIATILSRIDRGAIQRTIIDRPGTDGQIVRVDIHKARRLAYGDRLFFDSSARPLNPAGTIDTTPGLPFLNSLFAVHFGTFGGIMLRIVYGLLGLALCTVISSGVRIWLARRRGRGLALPLLERLWAGIVWGSAFALAASFAGAMRGFAPGPAFAATLAAALLLSIVCRDSLFIRRLLGAALAAAIVASLIVR